METVNLETFASDALEFAPLELSGAWHLSDSEIDRLPDESPPGGWRDFTALLGGTDYIDVTDGEFRLADGISPEVPLEADNFHKKLAESFTRRLVPPKTAAGLFIKLGLHPAWGVHLAHVSQARDTARFRDEPSGPNNMFPVETQNVGLRYLRQALQRIVDTAAESEWQGAEGFTERIMARIEEVASKLANVECHGGLDLSILSETSQSDTFPDQEFVIGDLIDGCMVPAGLATRDGNEVQFDTERLESLDVIH